MGAAAACEPQDIAFDEILAAAAEASARRRVRPRRARRSGSCTPASDVIALDQSERMVELTRARGVDARVGDVQALPFADGEFDVAVANFMLYHVPDVQRALGELGRVLRPNGTLVAATNGVRQLAELWELVGRDLSDRSKLFMRETGEEFLKRDFAHVRCIPLDGTVELTADDMRAYIASSVAHKSAVDAVPDFEGTRVVTTSSAVFVAIR